MILQLTVIVVAILLFSGAWFYKWFHRNPSRNVTLGDHFVAPADGTVLKIMSIEPGNIKVHKKYSGSIDVLTKDVLGDKKGYLINIFMSPFNVHMNRIPIDGVIDSVTFTKGSFKPVTVFQNGLENTRNEVILDAGKFKLKIVQIAGKLARTIECKARKGSKVKQGQVYGMIKLGSQATLIIPQQIGKKKVHITCKKGQKVKAGLDILAKIQ